MRRARLHTLARCKTDADVARLPLPATKPQDTYFKKLPGQRGLAKRGLSLLVSKTGTRSWRAIWYARVINGRTGKVESQPRSVKLGNFPSMGLHEAEARALALAAPPEPTVPTDLKSVGEQWYRRYVGDNGLRTYAEIDRRLRVYLYPALGHLNIYKLDRAAVVALFDALSDRRGRATAIAVISDLRSILTWFAGRHADYVSPLLPGTKWLDARRPAQKRRQRVLDDDEIRALWAETALATIYNRLVRFLLLVSQRWEKTVTLQAGDIKDGVWTVAMDHDGREHPTIGRVRLPPLALQVIAETPRMQGSPLVFSNTRRRPFNDVIRNQKLLHARMEKRLGRQLENWTHSDLRRTARTLMARIGISAEHADQVLGSENVRHRHDYMEEKSAALARLAEAISAIVVLAPKRRAIQSVAEQV